MIPKSNERRRFERVKKRSILRINQKIALLEDISEEGMLVSVQDVPSYPEVSISAGIHGSDFTLEGVIRWKSEQDDFSGLYSIGIELIEPPLKFRKMIKKILENGNENIKSHSKK